MYRALLRSYYYEVIIILYRTRYLYYEVEWKNNANTILQMYKENYNSRAVPPIPKDSIYTIKLRTFSVVRRPAYTENIEKSPAGFIGAQVLLEVRVLLPVKIFCCGFNWRAGLIGGRVQLEGIR